MRALVSVQRRLARIEEKINTERRSALKELPTRFGFRRAAEFIAAVRRASKQGSSRYSGGVFFCLDNALDEVKKHQQGAWGVNSEPPCPSATFQSVATPAAVTAVDLFAGAGGFSLAAKNLGIKVAAAVEHDSHACTTYKANFVTRRQHPPKLYEKDITALCPSDVAREALAPSGNCDMIMGGPPCQGFSVHRINGAGVNDPRNALLLRYFEFVRILAPKVFILENVPGMLWPRHADYVKNFYALANETGYDVKPPQVLNARDYGVPQNRKRVFVLGVKRGTKIPIVWPPAATHFAPASIEVTEQGRPAWRCAEEVFHAAPKGDINNIHMHHCDELVAAFQSTPHNGGSRHQSNRQLPCHDGHDGHKDVYGRINPRALGPTMTTACINPSKGRFLHPTQDHGITARQAARFQCFPDTFKFHGGLMAAGVQIGNAVPIALGMEVLRTILAGLKSVPATKAEAA